MNLKNISMKLLLLQLFSLVLSLFISSSRMLFLPWFVEDSFGLLGIFITTPLLLFIRVTMTYLKKRPLYNKNETNYSFKLLLIY
ncbi:hypothetical protein DZB88_26800 [Bacillus sp. OE]|nr:hypothetical protein DN392_28415 [Bacillus sp. BB51/4]RFB09343.1 hypothetical protein DZB88_26800 [Bacillus sp. OE]